MSALRWWLLILGVVFFSALTVWELRRPRQARRGDAPLEPTRPRDPTLQLPEMHAHEPLTHRALPVIELPADADELPVLEAAAPEEDAAVPGASRPEEEEEEEERENADAALEAREAPAEPAEAAEAAEAEWEEAPAEAHFEVAPEAAPAEGPGTGEPLVDWPPDSERRVVALRLVAPQPERFAGRSLRQALAAEGFVLGRFDIFHKGDEARRAILSAASLSQPGTFDATTMDSQHFGGLSLFAVLPGPKSPPEAFEELVSTARSLNERLCGVLQDEGGTPLTPARIASLKARLNSGAPA
ncbi:MAG TPA: cell division protein ZipA C-terminal FtsZ-binding domain-containing protein [Steroidobacteraceae bacterium]|nr:cell division protein ZipA C-terminal FtsZ-binding domain-containing protein [Steroidobacteraceae bacterium]